MVTAEWARETSTLFRANRTFLSDLQWRIKDEASKGGRLVYVYCMPETPGHTDAAASLLAAGFSVTVAPQPESGLLKTCVAW